ncbi:MAG: hypothetical protein QGG40_15550, partial [Myxococcota bacterium]|nr:hypothetical protein [Myxococcota bacterium]
AYDPVSGNAWFGDSEQGRAWRLDSFYNHATWGTWVPHDKLLKEDWNTPPSCFLDDDGLIQDGTCNGSETDLNDKPPRGWLFFHGGFAGNDELTGLTHMVADPARGRIWVLGPGWIQAIDTELATSEDEAGSSYTYTQLVPDFHVDLSSDWSNLWGGLWNDHLVLADRWTGSVSLLELPPQDQHPISVVDLDVAPELIALSGDLLFLASDELLTVWNLTSAEIEWAIDLDLGPDPGDAVSASADGETVWLAWENLVLVVDSDTQTRIPVPDSGVLRGIAFDRVEGGEVESLDLVYVLAADGEAGWLRALTREGRWINQPIPLSALPVSLGYAQDPHDLYVLYAAGSEGCSGELSELCEDGVHPALVQPFYNPYGLEVASSSGHPLNLFLYPIIETPKDDSVAEDFSIDDCDEDEDPGCCSLAWAMQERLEPNVAYFEETILPLGDETSETEDDPTLVWGVNPSFLRQARLCLESEVSGSPAIGRTAFEMIAARIGPRAELSAWNHTAVGSGGPNDDHLYYMELLYERGVDFDDTLDSQAEYALLHDGLAAVFDTRTLDDTGLDDMDLWSPVTSGIALDAEIITDPTLGWPEDEPSWVIPVRDGPLAIDQDIRQVYTFLSAGAQLDIGTQTYRKKELWPIDIRQRPHLHELHTDPAELGVEDPTSGLVNMAGLSWELGTLVPLSEAGG